MPPEGYSRSWSNPGKPNKLQNMQATIRGTTLPVLELSLNPGESVISTHGELSWMSPNIVLSQTTGSGGGFGGGLLAGVKRAIGGGSFFQTQYQCQGGGPGLLAFATKLPGEILPIQVTPGSGVMVHRHGFLCGTTGVTATAAPQQGLRAGMWGGEGFILQRVEGHGQAWIELSGEVNKYTLARGETLLVHPGHVGLFQESVSFQITRLQSVRNVLFGDNGFHLVALTGPGEIWLQSMPIPLLAHAIAPYLPQPPQR
jgi:uncharacterized protein (TIGR00266 family)